MSALIIFIGIAVVVFAALCYFIPAISMIAFAPFLPFVSAYRIRKESPFKSVVLVSVSTLFLLAVLLLWFIQH